MQMSYLYASEFLFKNFCKIAQHAEYEKNVWENGNDSSIRVQTTMNHISIFTFLCFYDNINVKQNFRARAEKGIARHIDVSGVVGT